MLKTHEMLKDCLKIDIDGVCLKPLVESLKMISKKWTLFIIMIFPNSDTFLRYSRISSRLNQLSKARISDTTLSLRLNELTRAGILSRIDHGGIPPKVEYSLTPRGFLLKESLLPLITWTLSVCHEN